MRNLTAQQLTAFTSPGVDLRLRLDLMRGADRLMADLTADADGLPWEVSWDLDGARKCVATFAVQHSDAFGASITPRGFRDAWSPWGSSVLLSLEAHVGDVVESVQVGELVIDRIPDAADATYFWLDGRPFALGSFLEVSAVDPLLRVERAGFGAEPLAPQEDTCYAELARLTGMPIRRTLDDRACPPLEYERKQGGRLDAVQELAEHLGGVLVPDSTGALVVIPDDAGDPVGTLDSGRFLAAPLAVDSEGVYNEVIGVFEDEERRPIVVEPAQIRSGPLAVTGPYGRYSMFYASDFVKSAAAARSALDRILAIRSRPVFEREFTTLLDPRVEIGDTWTAAPAGEDPITGVVTGLEWRAGGEMRMTLRYREAV